MSEPSERRRVLVISNETVEAETLHATIARGVGATEVMVVAPALSSRLRYWTNDDAQARHSAEARLESCLRALDEAGVDAHGSVGDANPMLAIEDALAVFPADELLIATHPEARSNWLAHDLVARACARFSLPVLHLVVEDAGVQASRLTAAAA
jgi:hypothetical protein